MADEKMPFTGHLTELRKRIFVSLAAVGIGFIASFNYSQNILDALSIPMKYDVVFKIRFPYIKFIPKQKLIDISLVFSAPAEPFWTHMKLAFIAGLVIAIPVIFIQLWKFVSPGLLKHERRYAAPFIISATGLFYLGVAFCFFFILPFAMGFLLTYKTESLVPMITISRYADFCLKFMLAFGLVFELPLVILFATLTGIVTPQALAKNRKYAVLMAFIVSAILTPTPDAFNQTLMAVPIMLLFEGGICVSRILLVRRRKDGKGQESQDAGK